MRGIALVPVVVVLSVLSLVALESAPAGVADGTRLRPSIPPLDSELRSFVARLAAELLDDLPPASGNRTLALLSPAGPAPPRVGKTVIDEWPTHLAASLAGSGTGWRVADRSGLESVLREQKLAVSSYADTSSGPAVGRIAPASSLLRSRIRDLRPAGPWLLGSATAQLVDVETGLVVWSGTARRRELRPVYAGLVLGGLGLLGVTTVPLGKAMLERARRLSATAARSYHHESLDRLLRLAVAARSRAARGDDPELTLAVQRAWTRLEEAVELARRTPGRHLGAAAAQRWSTVLDNGAQQLSERPPAALPETMACVARDLRSLVPDPVLPIA